MHALRRVRTGILSLAIAIALTPAGAGAQGTMPRDGQRDFDFEIGSWATRLSRLERPLSGSKEWVEYTGTTVVRRVWDGRANLVELDVSGPAGRIEGLSLRLYNPRSGQWTLNFASSGSGVLAVPSVGEFRNGRGEFLSHEEFNGRMILVRFVIAPLGADTYRFEQSYSDDGGRTWEANWIAIDTRMPAGGAQRR